mmetsp:Transcript_86735/g.250330  ORF Transcript_86735/g.250330 Transcript_86735/m.250330 type:complete len:212 (+) Transcript_86735:446-1081(+)
MLDLRAHEVHRQIQQGTDDLPEEERLAGGEGVRPSVHHRHDGYPELALLVALREELILERDDGLGVVPPLLAVGAEVGDVQDALQNEAAVGLALVLPLADLRVCCVLGVLEEGHLVFLLDPGGQTVDELEVFRHVSGQNRRDDLAPEDAEVMRREVAQEVLPRHAERLEEDACMHILEGGLVVVPQRQVSRGSDQEGVVHPGMANVMRDSS